MARTWSLSTPGRPKKKNGVSGASDSRHNLTIDDADAIGHLDRVAFVAPGVRGNVQAVAKSRNWSTNINGTSTSHFAIREWNLTAGPVFSADEERTAPKVAIIGAMAGERLFGTDDPMGQIVRILNTPFTVVGLLKPKGTSPEGRDQDDVIFIPITAAMTRLIGGEQSQS